MGDTVCARTEANLSICSGILAPSGTLVPRYVEHPGAELSGTAHNLMHCVQLKVHAFEDCRFGSLFKARRADALQLIRYSTLWKTILAGVRNFKGNTIALLPALLMISHYWA